MCVSLSLSFTALSLSVSLSFSVSLTQRHTYTHRAQVKSEAKLREVARLFDAQRVEYVPWTEEPEGVLTCLATRPYHKAEVAGVLKQAKTSLYRG